MKIRIVDKKTAAKKILSTILLIIALLVIVNYYLTPLVEKQLIDAASRIASSQNYDKEKVFETLSNTITSITDKLVYAYIIVVAVRTVIGLLDYELLNLITTRLLTITYLAYAYIALNQGKIILDLGENTVTVDASQLLTTTLTSITLIILGVTIIQAAHIIRQTNTRATSSKTLGRREGPV